MIVCHGYQVMCLRTFVNEHLVYKSFSLGETRATFVCMHLERVVSE